MPHLLLREIGLAVLGCSAVSMLQVCAPLQDNIKRIFQGAICVATLVTMARVGGIF